MFGSREARPAGTRAHSRPRWPLGAAVLNQILKNSAQENNIMNTLSRFALTAAVFAMTLSSSNPASAQTDQLRQTYALAANVSTNAPGIYTYAEPPSNFKPLIASDEELAAYGFPARPDKLANPQHYQLWERVVLAAKNRWNGELKSLPISRQRMTQPQPLPTQHVAMPNPMLPSSPETYNWSGVALTNTLTTFNPANSFTDIFSVISVPTSQLPFGAPCDQYFQLSWMGLDGFTKITGVEPGAGKAALIGGVYSYVQCSSSDAVYYMVLGWEPISISSVFSVHPGDLVYAEVGAPAGCTNPNYMFLEDLTTLTYSAYSIPVPNGVHFVGNSAQWIVERYCCRASGYPYPLANTIGTFFDGGAAIKGNGTYLYPGSQAASTSVLTMVDDAGSNIIELVHQGSSGYEGQHAIFFQTTGCAYTGGCAEK
jgi:hypothetical protein